MLSRSINRILFSTLTLLLLAASLMASCSTQQDPKSLELTLTATDIAWDINLIDAVVGEPISLTIVNDGVLDHNFKIEELGINIEIPAGAQEVVTFVISELGTFDYLCNVPGHAEAGMVGKIVVTE